MPSPLLRYFAFDHLPEGPLRRASQDVAQLAEVMDADLPDGPEKTVGLRKLLEAKDCFVRAALPPERVERLPHDDVPGLTPSTCPERDHHGEQFTYCPVKGCGWQKGMPA